MWIGVENPALDGKWTDGHTSAPLIYQNWLPNADHKRQFGQMDSDNGKWGAYSDTEPLVCEIDQKSKFFKNLSSN